MLALLGGRASATRLRAKGVTSRLVIVSGRVLRVRQHLRGETSPAVCPATGATRCRDDAKESLTGSVSMHKSDSDYANYTLMENNDNIQHQMMLVRGQAATLSLQ